MANPNNGSKKTILVIGATGQQGGSVAKHLIKSGQFNVRALVRNCKKKSAQQLQKLGVELVKGDLSDPSTLVTPNTNIFSGVTHLFLNTCWDLMTEKPQDEVSRGKNIIDLLGTPSASKLKHVIYSSIPEEVDNDESAPKQEIEQLLKQKLSDLKADKSIGCTIIYPMFFYENFLSIWPLFRHTISRKLYWCMFPAKDDKYMMESIAIEDLGGIILGVINNAGKMNDSDADNKQKIVIPEKFYAVSDIVNIKDILQAFSKVLKEPIGFEPLSLSQYRCLPFPKAVLDTIESYSTMSISGEDAKGFEEQLTDDLKLCKKLYPKLQNTTEWAENHKEELLGNFDEINDPDGKRKEMKSGVRLFKQFAVAKELFTHPSTLLTIAASVGLAYFLSSSSKEGKQ